MKLRIIALSALALVGLLAGLVSAQEQGQATDGADYFFAQINMNGISGCDSANERLVIVQYDYANWQGQYELQQGPHRDCKGEAVVKVTSGPGMPANFLLRAKPYSGLAVCFTDYVFSQGVSTFPTTYLGDANGDNAVDIADYGIVHAAFGCDYFDTCYDQRADFNNDQVVDSADWNLFIGGFGRAGCVPLW